MSESLRNLDQSSVLDDVRRALGRTATLAPEPLEPFIEPTIKADVLELMARFTEEASAVRAQVHRVGDNVQFVERITEICAADKGHEIALSRPTFAEMDLDGAHRAWLSTFAELDALDHDGLIARLPLWSRRNGGRLCDRGDRNNRASSDEPNALLVSLLPPCTSLCCAHRNHGQPR